MSDAAAFAWVAVGGSVLSIILLCRSMYGHHDVGGFNPYSMVLGIGSSSMWLSYSANNIENSIQLFVSSIVHLVSWMLMLGRYCYIKYNDKKKDNAEPKKLEEGITLKTQTQLAYKIRIPQIQDCVPRRT